MSVFIFGLAATQVTTAALAAVVTKSWEEHRLTSLRNIEGEDFRGV